METASARDAAFNKNTNQDPIDQLGPKYRADVADDWRRGGGKGGATSRPGFDKSGAWRAGRDGVSHGAGDPAIIRKPERNKP
jgi:hypothetical protein